MVEDKRGTIPPASIFVEGLRKTTKKKKPEEKAHLQPRFKPSISCL
jgi:hypothetical protein